MTGPASYGTLSSINESAYFAVRAVLKGMKRMIKIVAQFHFAPGSATQALALFRPLVEATRQEGGCKQYDLLLAKDDPDRFTILETWASQQALDAHSASAHFTQYVPQLSALSAEPPAVTTYTQIL